jgi:lactate racemase
MKTISWPFGKTSFTLDIPDQAQIKCMRRMAPLADPRRSLFHVLLHPIDSAPLPALAAGRRSAAIVVSDHTRPVPYKDPDGILAPILETLRQSGVSDIRILIACGTHREMTTPELREMLGPSAFQQGVRIINHVADDPAMSLPLGKTSRIPDVTVNRHYLQADLKILTGLVEPHFMAGYSGGRKALCPGVCGRAVTCGFHSAEILDHPRADTLVLDGNPCHEEALAVAKMAGVDFTVNVTINMDKRITGVFAGSLEKAHLAAVQHIRDYVAIPLPHEFDLVLIPAGDVGVNHYQCAKAVYEASRAVAPGGYILLTTDLTDPDPLGGPHYKKMLALLQRVGPSQFIQTIRARDWNFVPEQWQAQMWARAFLKLGAPDHLYTCAVRLRDRNIPETNVAAQYEQNPQETDLLFARRITQLTLDQFIEQHPNAGILLLPDGPYGVPFLDK